MNLKKHLFWYFIININLLLKRLIFLIIWKNFYFIKLEFIIKWKYNFLFLKFELRNQKSLSKYQKVKINN